MNDAEMIWGIPVQSKIFQPEVQQLLAPCGSIIHQTHEALVPDPCPFAGVRLEQEYSG